MTRQSARDQQAPRSQYLKTQLSRTNGKSYEAFVVAGLLLDPRLRRFQPVTQYVVKVGATIRLIDLYYPTLNLGIEIEEPHHLRAPNAQADLIRTSAIHDRLPGYQQIKAPVSRATDLFQKHEELVARILEFARRSPVRRHEPWRALQTHQLSDLQEKHRATIFVFVSGAVEPTERDDRYTGSWSIADARRTRIDRAVAVHNNEVVRVTEALTWQLVRAHETIATRRSNNGKSIKVRIRKYRYRGRVCKDHPLIGTLVAKPTDRSGRGLRRTTFYSTDVAQ